MKTAIAALVFASANLFSVAAVWADEGAPPPAPAQASSQGAYSVGLRAGTLGAGIEGSYGINPYLNVRAMGNFLNYNYSLNDSGVDYDAKLKLQTFGALLDYHPFAGIFRVSAGVMGNGNKADLDATCRADCDVGNVTISASDANNPPHVFGRARLGNSVAPYAGIGFGNSVAGGHWHFGFDLGVMFAGSPDISLGARGQGTVTDNNTGTSRTAQLESDPQVQSELRREEAQAEDDASQFKYYPVVAFSVGYRFGQ